MHSLRLKPGLILTHSLEIQPLDFGVYPPKIYSMCYLYSRVRKQGFQHNIGRIERGGSSSVLNVAFVVASVHAYEVARLRTCERACERTYTCVTSEQYTLNPTKSLFMNCIRHCFVLQYCPAGL